MHDNLMLFPDRFSDASARRRRLPSLLVAALVAAAGAAGAAAQETPEQRVFRETAEVNVVNVEVAVTDRQGRPVTGLQRDNFELLENGEPVEISNFFAVQGGREAAPRLVTAGPEAAAPPVPAGPRVRQNHLIVYVDNANIRETNRKKVFKSLREFLRGNWRQDLWAMVVSNDRSLTIRQEFTPELETVLDSLDRLEKKASAQPRFDAERRNLMRLIEDVNVEAGSGVFGVAGANPELIQGQAQALLPLIRGYSEERLQYVRETLGILDQFVSMAAGMPGRKSVLYVSDGLTLRPGEALYEGFARRFQLLGTVGANMSPELEAGRDDATGDFRDLVTRANTSGVTFYTIDASPSAAIVRGSAETGESAGGNFGAWRDAIESTEQSVRQDSLVMMADGTGGRYGFTPSSFDDLLEGVFNDFDNFYSLGYVADRLESGKKREITVRLRDNPGGLEVRYRRSFRDKTALELAAERAQAALLLDDLDNPLGITVERRASEPAADGNYEVQLVVKLDLAGLALVPEGDSLRGIVSLFVAVRDDRGRASGVRRILCPIQIPRAEAAGGEASGTAACGARLLMRSGRQRVAISVLDETAAVHSTTSLKLDVGATGQAALAPSEQRTAASR